MREGCLREVPGCWCELVETELADRVKEARVPKGVCRLIVDIAVAFAGLWVRESAVAELVRC